MGKTLQLSFLGPVLGLLRAAGHSAELREDPNPGGATRLVCLLRVLRQRHLREKSLQREEGLPAFLRLGSRTQSVPVDGRGGLIHEAPPIGRPVLLLGDRADRRHRSGFLGGGSELRLGGCEASGEGSLPRKHEEEDRTGATGRDSASRK